MRLENKKKVETSFKSRDKVNLEPHVILHLRITDKDIESYLEQKIQMDPLSISHLNGTPSAYEPGSFTPDNNCISGSSLYDDPVGMYASWSNPSSKPEQSIFFDPQDPQNPQDPQDPQDTQKSHESKEFKESKEFEESYYNLNVPSVSLDKFPDVPQPEPSENPNSSDIKFRILDAMCEFADANRRNEWPRSTSVWCRWCCSPFTGPPVSVPRWKIKKTFFVSGCYCSYSCAAAHLFFRGDITEDDKWESYNLLHLLRKKILNINTTDKISLADPQELLHKFGGHLSVEEFRERTKETHIHHKVYKVLYPPMVSIVPKIEEQSISVNSEDMRLLQTPGGVRAFGKMKYVAPKNENYHSRQRYGKNQPYIPIDKDRLVKARENLKIRRNKPLLDKKHTLFNYMNLQIRKKKSDI